MVRGAVSKKKKKSHLVLEAPNYLPTKEVLQNDQSSGLSGLHKG